MLTLYVDWVCFTVSTLYIDRLLVGCVLLCVHYTLFACWLGVFHCAYI